jgi:alditol oxidase
MPSANWAGNYEYRARVQHRPASIDQAQEIIARAERIRVLGSRHTFTSIADSDELISLDLLPIEVEVSPDEGAVTVPGAIRYGELAPMLEQHGLGLANLASLPHISVAGAIATATHGSGERNGNLATSVRALELIRSDGELTTCARGDPDFDGIVVGLGTVGALTRVTLDVEPTYLVHQRVYEHLSWEALREHFDEIVGGAYSVSAFTLWGEDVDQVWVKSREPDHPDALFGATPADGERHPIPGLDPANCTPGLGKAGPWFERLPHFRMGFTPSSGEEIQSEYLVPRTHAVDAIEAIRRLASSIRPLLQISEIRTVAADRLWMSPQYARESLGIHFTWRREQDAVERVLREIERALGPFDARPHWGKLFLMGASELAPRYERSDDFQALLARLDPRGAFRNDWLDKHLLG